VLIREAEMDKLITVKDVKARYGCSTPTARKYIRQCKPHMENPLTTFDWAFRDWEQSRLVVPERMTKSDAVRLKAAMLDGKKVVVPRRW
jgi:hypothetical protein